MTTASSSSFRGCTWRRRFRSLSSPILIALACTPALAAVRGQFIWTDVREIVDGRLILRGEALLRALFTGIDGEYYRPTVLLLHSAEAWAFGASPTVFRATNFLIHTVNSVCAFVVIRKITNQERLALAGACLFAAHPLCVTVVAWASDRTDGLALLAILLTVHLALSSAETRSSARLLAMCAAFLVGLGAKESVAAAVLIVLLLAGRAGPGAMQIELLLRALVLAAISALFFVWRLNVATNLMPDAGRVSLSTTDRVLIALSVHIDYASQLVAPWRLRVCDDVVVPAFGWPIVTLTLVTLSAVGAVLLMGGLGRDGRFLVGWIAALLLPTCGLVLLRHVRADRYLYGCLPAVTTLFAGAALRFRLRWNVHVVGGLWIVLASMTVVRADHFRSDLALWTKEIAFSPSCREGHSILARVAQQRGDTRMAFQHATLALERDPQVQAFVDEAGTLNLLGLARLATGEVAAAEAAFLAAIDLSRTRGADEIRYNLGLSRIAAGDPGSAISILEPTCVSPSLTERSRSDCRLLLAYALVRGGRNVRARNVLDQIDPRLLEESSRKHLWREISSHLVPRSSPSQQ